MLQYGSGTRKMQMASDLLDKENSLITRAAARSTGVASKCLGAATTGGEVLPRWGGRYTAISRPR